MSIEVTARDLETGETGTLVIDDDYVLITAGSCHLARTDAHSGGTHVLTVKGRRDGTSPVRAAVVACGETP